MWLGDEMRFFWSSAVEFGRVKGRTATLRRSRSGVALSAGRCGRCKNEEPTPSWPRDYSMDIMKTSRSDGWQAIQPLLWFVVSGGLGALLAWRYLGAWQQSGFEMSSYRMGSDVASARYFIFIGVAAFALSAVVRPTTVRTALRVGQPIRPNPARPFLSRISGTHWLRHPILKTPLGVKCL